jgi:hypothetical protein
MVYYDNDSDDDTTYFGAFFETNDVNKKLHKLNPNFNEIWIKKSSFNKKSDIEKTKTYFFTSGIYGSKIRNAATGICYNSTVGSSHEDLFFKVSFIPLKCKNCNNLSMLFYDSPSEFMDSTNFRLDPKIIAKWELKRKNCKLINHSR